MSIKNIDGIYFFTQISRALNTATPASTDLYPTKLKKMPPIFDKPTTDKYDYVVIGGGSGGSATAVSVFLLGYYGFSRFFCLPIGITVIIRVHPYTADSIRL